jgi:hypothetical protein
VEPLEPLDWSLQPRVAPTEATAAARPRREKEEADEKRRRRQEGKERRGPSLAEGDGEEGGIDLRA